MCAPLGDSPTASPISAREAPAASIAAACSIIGAVRAWTRSIRALTPRALLWSPRVVARPASRRMRTTVAASCCCRRRCWCEVNFDFRPGLTPRAFARSRPSPMRLLPLKNITTWRVAVKQPGACKPSCSLCAAAPAIVYRLVGECDGYCLPLPSSRILISGSQIQVCLKISTFVSRHFRKPRSLAPIENQPSGFW
jgi:hypothetical protein